MRTTTFLVSTLFVAGSLGAQVVHGRAPDPVRRGGIAPAPAPAPAAPAQPLTPAVPIAVGYVPAVLLSDGRIFADFGLGYEQVVRSCDGGFADRRAAPEPAPTYAAPVVGVRAGTGAITPARAGGVAAPPPPQTSGATSTGTACWIRDARGSLFVIRR